jgi:hypothetical protein
MVFVGHISVDKVENVNGSRTQPGGAALYAVMAANPVPECCFDFSYWKRLQVF